MSKYIYPAIFTSEKNGAFSVVFPDIEGCFTSGKNLQDAFEMASDALALMLYHYEQEKKEIPKASDVTKIKTSKNDFMSLVSCDTIEYQKMNNNKAVKKTLTVKEWLNEAAMKENVNFSRVLEKGLLHELGIA